MIYSILIYGDEHFINSMPDDLEQVCLNKHRELQRVLDQESVPFASARLVHSASAVTLKPSDENGPEPFLMDGPFAETKEQFLGLYLVDVASLDDAITLAKYLPTEYNTIEIRPVDWTGGNMLVPSGQSL